MKHDPHVGRRAPPDASTRGLLTIGIFARMLLGIKLQSRFAKHRLAGLIRAQPAFRIRCRAPVGEPGLLHAAGSDYSCTTRRNSVQACASRSGTPKMGRVRDQILGQQLCLGTCRPSTNTLDPIFIKCVTDGQHAIAQVDPMTVIGAGRIGSALVDMGTADDVGGCCAGWSRVGCANPVQSSCIRTTHGIQVLVRRGERVPADAPAPIVVATRNDDLDAVLEAVPSSRHSGTCCSNSME